MDISKDKKNSVTTAIKSGGDEVKKKKSKETLNDKRTKITPHFIEEYADDNETECLFSSTTHSDGTVTITVIPKNIQSFKDHNTQIEKIRILLDKYNLLASFFMGLIIFSITSNMFIFLPLILIFSVLLYFNKMVNPTVEVRNSNNSPHNANYPFITLTLSEYNFNKFTNGNLSQYGKGGSSIYHNYAESISELNEYRFNYKSLYEVSLASLVNNAENIAIDEKAFINYKNDCEKYISELGVSGNKVSVSSKSKEDHKALEGSLKHRQNISDSNNYSAYELPVQDLEYIKSNGGPEVFTTLEKVYDRLNESERRDYEVCSKEWRTVHEASMVISDGPLASEQTKVLNNVTVRVDEILGKILYNVNERTLNDMKISEVFLEEKYNK